MAQRRRVNLPPIPALFILMLLHGALPSLYTLALAPGVDAEVWKQSFAKKIGQLLVPVWACHIREQLEDSSRPVRDNNINPATVTATSRGAPKVYHRHCLHLASSGIPDVTAALQQQRPLLAIQWPVVGCVV